MYQTIVKQPPCVWEQRDLAVWKSMDLHGIKFSLERKKGVSGEEIIQIFQDHKIARGTAVFICQNPAFDRNFFAQLIDVYTQEQMHWPYHWLDFASMFWALHFKDFIVRITGHFPLK